MHLLTCIIADINNLWLKKRKEGHSPFPTILWLGEANSPTVYPFLQSGSDKVQVYFGGAEEEQRTPQGYDSGGSKPEVWTGRQTCSFLSPDWGDV